MNSINDEGEGGILFECVWISSVACVYACETSFTRLPQGVGTISNRKTHTSILAVAGNSWWCYTEFLLFSIV